MTNLLLVNVFNSLALKYQRIVGVGVPVAAQGTSSDCPKSRGYSSCIGVVIIGLASMELRNIH